MCRNRSIAPWIVLTALLAPAVSLYADESDELSRSPFAGKYLALHIRGRNYPLPFQEANLRYLGERCYIVGKVVPNILPKDRHATGTVWFPVGDADEIVEFDTLAKLREYYNLAH